MEYINNIYDYPEVEMVAHTGLRTRRAIVGQGITLHFTHYPDRPWMTTAQYMYTAPGVNHATKINVKVEDHSAFELHLCNIIDSQDTIKYDINVDVEDYSDVTISVASITGKKVDVNINVNILGEHSTVNLPGLLLPAKDESFTYHSNVVHTVGNSKTTQKVRTVASDNGYGDFFGIIKVNPDAQKTETEQVNNNILLSTDARIESKPQLEIYADDVKCSHGSTTGMLDQEAIFYMRSRGISEKTAQNLLLQSFIDEIVDNVTADKDYTNLLKDCIAEKLGMETD